MRVPIPDLKEQDRVVSELPKLAAAVVRSEVDGEPSYDVAETGAAQAVRGTAKQTTHVARGATAGASRTTRQARKRPGVATAERHRVKGADASTESLPISRYDELTAEEILAKLAELSQTDLAQVHAYERTHDNRSTVLTRIDALRDDEPWPGYDELTVEEIRTAIGDDDDRARAVRRYERAHKNRAGVMDAADRELANA
jgi:hypothetical protein